MPKAGTLRLILPAAGVGLVLVSLAVALVYTFGATTTDRIAEARELVNAGQFDEAERILDSLTTDVASEITERQALLARIRERRRSDLDGRREDLALANARKAAAAGDYATAAHAIEDAGEGNAAFRREISRALVEQAKAETAEWDVEEAERLLKLARKALEKSAEVDAAEMTAEEARRQKDELTRLLAEATAAEEAGDYAEAEAILSRARRLPGPADLTAAANARYETAHGQAEEERDREKILAQVQSLLDKGKLREARKILDQYAKTTGDSSLAVHADALQKLEEQGGAKSYLPVRRALRWLAAHQDSDGGMHNDTFHQTCKYAGCRGSGPKSYDTGVTGLTLMAFTAFSELDVLGEFREPAEKAAKFLMVRVGKDGRVAEAKGITGTYTEAIVALALLERSRVVADPSAEIAVATRTVKYLRDVAHLADGGWRYSAKSNESDVSVTCWVVQALHAAKSNGIAVEDETIHRTLQFIDYLTNADGLTSYTLSSSRHLTMTPAGLLARRLFGEERASPRLVASAKYVYRYFPTRYLRPKAKRSGPVENDARRLYTGSPSFYQWYYQTYALRMMGGKLWKTFGPGMEKTLLTTQETNGHALGSWDPVLGWSRNSGRIYATAMATLTLEVYYRSKAGLSVAPRKAEEKKAELLGSR